MLIFRKFVSKNSTSFIIFSTLAQISESAETSRRLRPSMAEHSINHLALIQAVGDRQK